MINSEIYPNPLVTIITPTWNRADLLPATIDSIMAQDYPAIEYLIIDDGSTDNTRAVVAEYMARYPGRIQYHYKENGGEASATNLGWQLAQGEFVAVVCSDDPQEPELVRESVKIFHQHPQAIVSYPDWWVLSDAGEKRYVVQVPEHDFTHMVRNMACYVGPGAFIRKSAVFDKMPKLRDERFVCVSDFSCWLNMGLFGEFVRVPKPVGAWRDHPTGATQIYRGMKIAREHILLYQDFFARPDLPPRIAALKKSAMAKCYLVAAVMVQKKTPLQAVEWIWKSLTFSPLRVAWAVIKFIKHRLGCWRRDIRGGLARLKSPN